MFLCVCILQYFLFIRPGHFHSNRGIFTSSLAIWMYFIYFYCINAKFRSSNILCTKSGRNGHPFLVHDLRRKTLFIYIYIFFTIEGFCSFFFFFNKNTLSASSKPLSFLVCWVFLSRNVAGYGQMSLSMGSSRAFFLLFT